MLVVRLKRVYLDNCTVGVLSADGFKCVTLELPWKDNAEDISCIPEGLYICKNNHMSPSQGRCISITNVVQRSLVLIHIANWTKDILGCIAVGESLSALNTEPMVANSKKTLTALMDTLPDSFLLEVK